MKELREKKEWYKVQPRGSVPTATEIRKANEKAAAKLRQEDGDADGPKGKSGKGGKNNQKTNNAGFALSNDDFAPLGAGSSNAASSSVFSSWGKSSTQPIVSDDTPTPAEAAGLTTEGA